MKRKLLNFLGMLVTFGLALPLALVSLYSVAANAVDPVVTAGQPTITREGCKRIIEKTERVEWKLPRQPIDLVILQDTSGSFKDTIHHVQAALKELTTPVALKDYDENNPRLVFTGDAETTDRVMINTFQGLDGTYSYDQPRQAYDWYGNSYNTYPSDSNFTVHSSTTIQENRDLVYQFKSSQLLTSKAAIDAAIGSFKTNGGTPTVPAIDDTIDAYNKIKGEMKNNRKTVFLLVTDGVANGVRKDGRVVLERSKYRDQVLQPYFVSQGVDLASQYIPEASQNYLARAKELEEAGRKLNSLVISNDGNSKNDGAVVVGFWEQVSGFTTGSQYGTAYLNGFRDTGVNTGDNRSVQSVFHSALQSVSTDPSKYYVNEQRDPSAFAQKILKAVGQALVKENVDGNFKVTEGYTVDAVRINGKTVVEKVTDEKTQVLGKITQVGTDVTISVPESIFNPGDNKFDYDLSRTTASENVSEDDEVDPSDDYIPKTEKITVPQLTGKFKVGEYETAEIGNKQPTSVEVEEILYCYPSATKQIADKDPLNDRGVMDDPLKLSKKKSYGADLTESGETFTYTILYRYNNSPYEWEENAMLVDPLDYRLEVVGTPRVLDPATGNTLSGYQVKTMTQQDAAGNDRTVVYAVIPKTPGTKAEDKGPYDGLVFKQARLVVEVKLKEEYQEQGTDVYDLLLQANSGNGALNQASIMWNGGETPNEEDHAARPPGKSTMRRSNAVYVKPPVATKIDKKVNNKEHEDLKTPNEEFTYTLTSPWPGLVDSFSIKDTVVDELEIVEGSAEVIIGGKGVDDHGLEATISGQTLSLDLDKQTLDDTNLLVFDGTESKELKNIVITFKAKIRENANLAKHTKDGVIKIPNTATVQLNGNDPITSNKVTVTPPKPTDPEIKKTINGSLESLTTFDDLPYTYNIVTTIPNDLASYKKFVIKDILDNNLVVDGEVTFKEKGVAELFDIKVDKQVVTATVKDGKFADVAKLSTVELVIPTKVKKGVTGLTIENKATIDFTNSKGEDKEKESNPVTVTPPTPSKKIKQGEQELDHLDIETEKHYDYSVKVTLPTDLADYKSFVISDTLDDKLSFYPDEQAFMADGLSSFFEIEQSGQTVTATVKDFKKLGELYGGRQVELIIPAKINKGETTPNIPNTAKIIYTNSKDVKGEKETNPVTVTPPPSTPPTIEKKIVDGDQLVNHLDIATATEYEYDIKVTLPNDIQKYTEFVIKDDVDSRLNVKGVTVLGEHADKFTTTEADNNKVRITAKADQIKNLPLSGVINIRIKAEIKAGETDEKIPNDTFITSTKPTTDGKPGTPTDTPKTPPVTVTPPPSTPPTIEKKIVDGDQLVNHLDIATATEYEYDIKVTLPNDIQKYTEFVIKDDVDSRLNVKGVTVLGEHADKFTTTEADNNKV
ncbi:isopeptide-forming domain-containing fimbrial protein, partial [Streptococcus rupicaprae]